MRNKTSFFFLCIIFMMWILSLVLLSFFILVKPDDQFQTETCVRTQERFVCVGDFPTAIPDNVSDVSVKDYEKATIGTSSFQDGSWSKVKTLQLYSRNIWFNAIRDYTFVSLRNLTTLMINASDLENFGVHAFAGLDHLNILDLSGCVSLEIKSLVKALGNVTTAPDINTLLLNEAGSKFNEYMYLDQDFMDTLIARNITRLSMASTNLYIKVERLMKHCVLPIVEVNMSNTHHFLHMEHSFADISSLLGNLKIFDISRWEFRSQSASKRQSAKYKECGPNEFRMAFYTRMEMVYANNLPAGDVIDEDINGGILNATQCSVSLRLVHLRSSHIHCVNVTILWPMEAPKIEVDLSDNGMNFFIIKGYVPISKLDLSRNQLYKMENHADFVNAFAALPFIEELVLNNNGLHRLPRDIFVRNTRLINIRLHGNQLKMMSFEIGHLHNLRILDMRDNKVEYINENIFSEIDKLQTLQLQLNNTQTVEFDLRHNTFACSCENLEFVRWLMGKRNQTSYEVNDVTCIWKSQRTVQIDENTLMDIYFLCKRTLIITISSSIATVALAIVVVTLVIWRRRIKKREVEWFIQQFTERKTKQRFLALLSHSNTDSLVTHTCIRPRLENAMRKVVPVDFDLLCLGDIHFRPGMAIVGEIHKSVSESCIAIFVVSRAFCESGYCLCEMQEAYAQRKPMILMFLEEVDEQTMTPLMQSIFSRYSRVKITREGGDIVITPSWVSLTQSIITLAVNEVNRTMFSTCW